jgi:2-hydroxy-4-carboxymuconate semialdehyde hemiacetal dehydrogenase
VAVTALQGPIHPELGIAMDMSIGLQSPSGALCSLALSFNNDGPFGTWFRYIGDTGTYVARYDALVDGQDKPVDLSGMFPSQEGYELQNREFFAAVEEGREPNASVAQCLPAMRTLDRIARTLP